MKKLDSGMEVKNISQATLRWQVCPFYKRKPQEIFKDPMRPSISMDFLEL